MSKEPQLQAFIEDLYLQYRRQLLRLVHKYISDPAAREDVFHDVFVCIIQKAELLRQMPKYKMEAYLCMIVRGVSVDYLRKNHCANLVDLEDSLILTLIDKQHLQNGSSTEANQSAELFMMLESLPMEDQILLWGKYYLELSTKELAELTGHSQTAVRTKVHRAKHKLFAQWQEHDLHWEDFIHG